MNHNVHLVLVGASIGQAWNLPGWPDRTKSTGVTAEAVAAWQFDKTEAVDEVLMRPARKFRPTRSYFRSLLQPPPQNPDIVVLKECSSYFPGNLRRYQSSVRSWTERLRARGVQVVVATVVPVTKARAGRDFGKQEAIVAYNRWLRQYALEQRLVLLDLETALRSDDSAGYLREEFAAADGSHLNARAYALLDQTLKATLCAANPAIHCQDSTNTVSSAR
jgi:GDSL-like Lipase/Acylhydrolase family